MMPVRKRKKPDALIDDKSGKTAAQWRKENAIYAAVKPFDTAMAEIENRWGPEKLIGLVSPETATKFASAMSKLDDAIEGNEDPAFVAKKAAVLCRGLKAMEAEAIDAGHEPGPKEAIKAIASDGREFLIAMDLGDAALMIKAGKKNVWSLEEVANVMQAHNSPLLEAVKKEFPNSTIKNVKTDWSEGDEIPF